MDRSRGVNRMHAVRIGQGWDRHRLVPGRKLVLGGVEIPFDKGLDVHSDADVLTHAIIDAILGAIGSGDIGSHFPDSGPAWKGACSLDLLKRVWDEARSAGYSLVNLDSTIVAEAPRIGPHRDAMRAALARVLGVEAARISIKAKTAEGCGPEGRGEAVAAEVVLLLSAHSGSG